MKLLSLIQYRFISPNKYAQRFQGETPSRGIGVMAGVTNGLFCMVIYLAVELCAAYEVFVTGVVVLVGFDMIKDMNEG
jgi:hypothetical protein